MKRLIVLLLLLAESFAIGLGSLRAQISGGGGSSGATVAWGSISGTLSNQTDLNTALTGKQPVDSDITAIAALATTSYGRSILTASDAASAQSMLSLVPGSNVQPFNANLTTYAGITPSLNVQSLLSAASYAAMRTQLTLVPGTDVQVYSAGLAQIAGLLDPNADRIVYWNDALNSYAFATVVSPLTFAGGSLGLNGSAITGIVATQVAFLDNDNKFTGANVEEALEELNDVNPTGPNSATGKVSWTQLVNVPSGFADGIDNDTGGGAGTDSSAIHTNVAGEITGITLKATPVAADKLVLEDSAAANAKKSIAVSSLATPLSALLNLSSLQGSVTDAQVPNDITVNLATQAVTALAGSNATGFFPTGQIERARGGTGVDTSAMGVGLFGSNASNAFVDVDTIGELETMIGGTNLLTPQELDSASEFTSVLGVGGTATSGTFLRGDWTWGAPTLSPAGADKQIQFNDGGVLGANAGLTYDKGTSTLTLTTLSTTNLNATNLTFTSAMVLPDGVRQTFNPNATTPGLNVGAQAGDPTTPTNGDLWYDSTGNLLRARINGANVSLGAGGSSSFSLTGTHASPNTTTPLSPTWTAVGHYLFEGATGTINLPATSGYAGRSITIYNTGAFTISTMPNASEVMVRDGTVQTGGSGISLSSGAGNYLELFSDGARWISRVFKGTLAEVVAAVPAFVAEIQRTASAFGSTSQVITLTGGIPIGNTVVALSMSETSGNVSAVSDSKGNTWTVHASQTSAGNQTVTIASAYVTTALVSSDTITLTWTDGSFQGRGAIIVNLTGCASAGQPDVIGSGSAFSGSVSQAATTTAAKTLCIGLVSLDRSASYSGGAWTSSGGLWFPGGSRQAQLVYSQQSTAGSKDPGGSWSTGGGQANLWVAFK